MSAGEIRTAGVVEAMATLRRRCPWSSTQDHTSLQKFAREETEELIEALADFTHSPSTTHRDAVVEELGDVFYQVLFHSALLDEESAGTEARGENAAEVRYGETLRLIIDRLEEKLVRRHPLAFGEDARDGEMAPLEDVEREYRRIKSVEKQQKSVNQQKSQKGADE